jgi:hypothetical protein
VSTAGDGGGETDAKDIADVAFEILASVRNARQAVQGPIFPTGRTSSSKTERQKPTDW